MSNLLETAAEKATFKRKVEERVNKTWFLRDKDVPKHWKNKDTETDGIIHTTAGVVKTIDNNIHFKPAQRH